MGDSNNVGHESYLCKHSDVVKTVLCGHILLPPAFLKKFTNFFTSGSLGGLDVSGGLGIQRCFYSLLDDCLQIRLYASESDVYEVRIWYTRCQKPINRVSFSSFFHEITRVASANPLMFIISIA